MVASLHSRGVDPTISKQSKYLGMGVKSYLSTVVKICTRLYRSVVAHRSSTTHQSCDGTRLVEKNTCRGWRSADVNIYSELFRKDYLAPSTMLKRVPKGYALFHRRSKQHKHALSGWGADGLFTQRVFVWHNKCADSRELPIYHRC